MSYWPDCGLLKRIDGLVPLPPSSLHDQPPLGVLMTSVVSADALTEMNYVPA